MEAALGGGNVILQQATGSGKTNTFMAPIFINALNGHYAHNLIVTPLLSIMSQQLATYYVRSPLVHFTAVDPLEPAHRAAFAASLRGSPLEAHSHVWLVNPEGIQCVLDELEANQHKIAMVVFDEGWVYTRWVGFRPAIAALKGFARILRQVQIVVASALFPVAHQRMFAEWIGRDYALFQLEQHIAVRRHIDYTFMPLKDLDAHAATIFARERFPLVVVAQSLEQMLMARAYLLQFLAELVHVDPYAATYHERHLARAVANFGLHVTLSALSATIAFGMGVHCDARSVVLWGVPNDIAEYGQIAGRAGRVGQNIAYATTLLEPNTLRRAKPEMMLLLRPAAVKVDGDDDGDGGDVAALDAVPAGRAVDADAALAKGACQLCTMCLEWRPKAARLQQGNVCADWGFRCRTAPIPQMCILLLLYRFEMGTLESLELSPASGNEPLPCSGPAWCDFCRPIQVPSIPAAGQAVQVTSQSSVYFGRTGIVEDVQNTTRLKVDFGGGEVHTLDFRLVTVTSDLLPEIEPVEAPHHRTAPVELMTALTQMLEPKALELRYPADGLILPESLKRLIKYRPETLQALATLDVDVYPSVSDDVVRVIAQHQTQHARSKRAKQHRKVSTVIDVRPASQRECRRPAYPEFADYSDDDDGDVGYASN